MYQRDEFYPNSYHTKSIPWDSFHLYMVKNSNLYRGGVSSTFRGSSIAVIHPLHVVVSSSGFILLAANFQLLWTRIYAEHGVGKV
jgi:hypothetical protein